MDKKNILKETKLKGEQYILDYNKEKSKIMYYVHIIDNAYYWLFENNELDKTLNGRWKFNFTNLQLEEDHNKNTIEIKLEPGDRILKKIEKIIEGEKST